MDVQYYESAMGEWKFRLRENKKYEQTIKDYVIFFFSSIYSFNTFFFF